MRNSSVLLPVISVAVISGHGPGSDAEWPPVNATEIHSAEKLRSKSTVTVRVSVVGGGVCKAPLLNQFEATSSSSKVRKYIHIHMERGAIRILARGYFLDVSLKHCETM